MLSFAKTKPLRDERFKVMCRSMPCQSCGLAGPLAGVTWAHSNFSEHGKGGARKADDCFVAALCFVCHRNLDQGSKMSYDERRAFWYRAYERTVRTAVRLGLWPRGVVLPAWFAEKRGAMA